MVLPRDSSSGTQAVREHRLVVLPDFQGLGIGLHLSEALAHRAQQIGLLGCPIIERAPMGGNVEKSFRRCFGFFLYC